MITKVGLLLWHSLAYGLKRGIHGVQALGRKSGTYDSTVFCVHHMGQVTAIEEQEYHQQTFDQTTRCFRV
jgi:hypothetical protein